MLSYIKKNLKIALFLKSREIRKLPWRVLFEFFRILQKEKIISFDGKVFSNGYIPEFPSFAFDRFAKIMAAAANGNFLPQALVLSVTNKCEYDCWHCYNKHAKGPELTFREIKKIIDFFQNLGIFGIFLAGGEPLLRNDILEIVKYASKKSVVRMESSGYGLTENMAKKLKAAGLSAIKISLDHYDEKKMNTLRGHEEAFKTSLSAIKNAKKARLYTSSVMVVSREMLYSEQINTYLNFVVDLGVNEAMIFQPKPSGSLIGADDSVLLNDRDRAEIINLHKKVNRNHKVKIFCLNYFEDSGMFGCNAGSTNFYVDATGNFTPCPVVSLSLGNLREESMEIILGRFKKYFRQPRDRCLSFECQKQIRSCFYNELPLKKEESEKILKNILQAELPGFYKKINKQR